MNSDSPLPNPPQPNDDDPSSGEQREQKRSNPFQRLLQRIRMRTSGSARADLETALSAVETGADFSPGERAMLNNILSLRELRVEDVMIPRADIEAVELDTTIAELLELFESSGHSRMPVYVETLDDPRGMIHIRDVVGWLIRNARARRRRKPDPANGEAPAKPATGKPARLDLSRIDLTRTIGEANLMRTVLFVPPSMLAADLMSRMQATRIQMALVIDEYGGTDGLVSLEDIVEMVVGDIEDEHDDDEAMIKDAGDGVLVVDAKVEIDELGERLGEAFLQAAGEEEVDTLGGLIVARLGRVPARGEVVPPFAGYEFQVVEADPRRVKRVRIVPDRAMARRRVQRKEPAVNALPAPMTAPAAEPAPEQEAAPQVIGVEGAEGGR